MTTPAKSPSPESLSLLSRARLLGRIGSILFLLALFCIIDAVQSSVRAPFNTVEIVAGKSVSITGVLPFEVETAESMTFFFEGTGAENLSFSPTASYRGFWLGGDMWRGTLTASPDAHTGDAVLTIVDLVPANKVKKKGEASEPSTEDAILVQNPGLVYSVKVWSSKKEADQASLSFFTRATGTKAPLLAVISLVLALGASIISFFIMRKAEAGLALESTFIIHGSKIFPHGLAVFFTIPRGMVLSTEKTPMASLCSSDGQLLAEGSFIEIAKGKGTTLFSGKVAPPRYGWLIRLH